LQKEGVRVAKVRVKATLTVGSRNYLAGDVIELPDEQAEEFIKRELAELIEEKIDLAEKKPKKKGGK
jgi:hypothetical protein